MPDQQHCVLNFREVNILSSASLIYEHQFISTVVLYTHISCVSYKMLMAQYFVYAVQIYG